MRAAVYVRISRDREGAGLGVERQRDDCTQLAERLGWTVIDTYTDNDISAYSGASRPGYDQMCADLDAGKAQAVLAWHSDRLHRRPIELESFIDLCDRRDIQVQTVTAGTVDLSTPSGKAIARTLIAWARHEVEHSIERQKRAKQQAALDGKYRGGRRAFGYEADGVTANSVEAAAIRDGAEKVLTGVSLRQITREWNAAGLRTSFGGKEFASREVRKILLRPRNAGLSLHDGKPVADGQWEKILDADTHAALVAMLRSPDRVGHGFERKYQGSGVYVCGKCGARMTVAVHNGTKSDGWRRTYACSAAKHLGRDMHHLDYFVDEVVIGKLSEPDAAISLTGPEVADAAELQRRRDGIRARLDELSEMFADGSIDGPQLKRGTADLRSKLDGIESELAAARSASAMANLVLSGDDLRTTWHNTPPDVRGKIIDTLMTVTVQPAPRGRRPGGVYFDPDHVDIDWKE